MPYAHHYILQLLEFPANGGGYGEVVSLGDGSNSQNSLAMVPHDIWSIASTFTATRRARSAVSA
jgi:hypothetical protein